MRLPVLVLALGLGLGQGPSERPILERPGVLELTLPERAGIRVRHFRLDDPNGDGETPIGIARLCRIPRLAGEPEDAPGEQLELDVRFFAPAVRVLSVERLTPDAVDLVWRELGGRGRTVHVAWNTAGGSIEIREAGGAAIRQREHDAGEGLCTPLFLLEAMRLGRLSNGEFRRLNASTGEVEPLRYETQPAYPPFGLGGLGGPGGFGGPGLRFGVWRRADASLAGTYLLRGDEVLAFQLQAGGPIARRVTPARFETLERAHRGPLASR